MNNENKPNTIGRRTLIKTGIGATIGGVFNIGSSARADVPLPIPDSLFTGAIDNLAVPRWADPLPIPAYVPVLSAGTLPANYTTPVGKVLHGVAPEWSNHPADWDKYPTQYYQVNCVAGRGNLLPNSMKLTSAFWGYQALTPTGALPVSVPGPAFRFRAGQPAMVRFNNKLPEEMSIHMHGGHWPAHSDGHASFMISPNNARDYYYPNVLPRKKDGTFDITESPSSMWYHDHALDMTAPHVARGLAGGCQAFDDLELGLISTGVLPGIKGISDVGPYFDNPYDISLFCSDRVFHPTGDVWYDNNAHNGYLGNVELVNGKAYPTLQVEARKYRFRVCGSSNSRIRRLRLSNNDSFLRIAKDAWLFGQPQRTQAVMVGMANRADIIIDFSKYKAGTEIFLENILHMSSPRGADGTLEDAEQTTVTGTPAFNHRILRFKVVAKNPLYPDATITDTTALRPHEVIQASEVVAKRSFVFERQNGQWAINQSFYDPAVANACPTLGSVEEWTLKNGAGGWWHPIHIHLESHQHVANLTTGLPIPQQNRWKHDVTMLGPNTELVIRMRFRTFKGPFVFHCHNVEHEDLEMMFQFDPRAVGSLTPQPPQAWYP